MIRFQAEQTGPAELELTSRLSEAFRVAGGVRAAYLVRVTYGVSEEFDVALCVSTRSGRDEPSVLTVIEPVFASIFGPHEHLDIVFVNGGREAAVRSVCEPFYQENG
jgi:hypothetical protein